MDRKAIIDGLKMTRDLCVFDPSTGEEIEPHLLNDINRATYDACKGALEILEQLDTDSDTISRQAAIEEFEKHCYPVRYGYNSVESGMTLTGIKQVINDMPAAQPEILRCKDCIHSDIYPKGADNDMPLKCLGIRYGGVMPDWYCEHAERRV